MRNSSIFDEIVVEAIHRIRGTLSNVVRSRNDSNGLCKPIPAAGRWRVIALTNNYAKSESEIIGGTPPSPEQYPNFSAESELAFLGWQEGPTPPRLRALFDDFCNSSTLGMR